MNKLTMDTTITMNDAVAGKKPIIYDNYMHFPDMTNQELKAEIEKLPIEDQIVVYIKIHTHDRKMLNDIGDGTAFTFDLTLCGKKMRKQLISVVKMSKENMKRTETKKLVVPQAEPVENVRPKQKRLRMVGRKRRQTSSLSIKQRLIQSLDKDPQINSMLENSKNDSNAHSDSQNE